MGWTVHPGLDEAFRAKKFNGQIFSQLQIRCVARGNDFSPNIISFRVGMAEIMPGLHIVGFLLGRVA